MKNKIIQFLRDSQGHISGEEISRQLKMSRAGVWKHIQELRKEGYVITAAKPYGYQLESVPDKLIPGEIQDGLETGWIGKKIYYYDSLPSTMETAFRLGLDGALEGTVVCAEGQTKGKGRLGRYWASPKGKGIYMSVILRPTLSLTDTAKLTLLSAVALCEAIRIVTGVLAEIKWPNDILIKGKKVAGILTELNAETDQVRFIVVGMGVNVNTSLRALPGKATSLKMEIGKKISRVALIQEIFRCLEKWEASLKTRGFSPMIDQWKAFSCTLGRRVRVGNLNGDVEGEAVDLDEYGGLVVKSAEGRLIKRMSGDVLLLG